MHIQEHVWILSLLSSFRLDWDAIEIVPSISVNSSSLGSPDILTIIWSSKSSLDPGHSWAGESESTSCCFTRVPTHTAKMTVTTTPTTNNTVIQIVLEPALPLFAMTSTIDGSWAPIITKKATYGSAETEDATYVNLINDTRVVHERNEPRICWAKYQSIPSHNLSENMAILD